VVHHLVHSAGKLIKVLSLGIHTDSNETAWFKILFIVYWKIILNIIIMMQVINTELQSELSLMNGCVCENFINEFTNSNLIFQLGATNFNTKLRKALNSDNLTER
jgi:hypothetical protein